MEEDGLVRMASESHSQVVTAETQMRRRSAEIKCYVEGT